MKTPKRRQIWQQIRQDWPLYALWLVVVVLTGILYARFPDQVPIHWDWHGQPDRFVAKSVAVLVMPATAVAVHLVVVVATVVDPRGRLADQPAQTLRLFRLATPVFLLGVHVVMMADWLGKPVDMVAMVFAGCGLLFAALGNVMGRLKPNYFIGFRLPWTLENDVVWKKTHRFGGRLWFVGGFAMVCATLLAPGVRMVYFLGIVAVLTIAPMVYAYRQYQRID